MKALDEIKAATAKLTADEQTELFRWRLETDAFKERQLAALKRDLQLGLDQLEAGRYKSYEGDTVMQLAEEIGKRGRERFEAATKNKKG